MAIKRSDCAWTRGGAIPAAGVRCPRACPRACPPLRPSAPAAQCLHTARMRPLRAPSRPPIRRAALRVLSARRSAPSIRASGRDMSAPESWATRPTPPCAPATPTARRLVRPPPASARGLVARCRGRPLNAPGDARIRHRSRLPALCAGGLYASGARSFARRWNRAEAVFPGQPRAQSALPAIITRLSPHITHLNDPTVPDHHSLPGPRPRPPVCSVARGRNEK